MTHGPHRFADIVTRLFPPPKEPIVTQPLAPDPHRLPSAEDHYRRACEHLEHADQAGMPIAEVHSLTERAHKRLMAAEVALRIWPADPPLLSAEARARMRTILDAGEPS